MRGIGLFTGLFRPANLGPPTVPIYETIKEAAEANYGVAYGSAGDPKNIQMPMELAYFALESNEFIAENTGKMNRWAAGGTMNVNTWNGVYDFADYNQTVEYAHAVGARYRQHVLFYFQNLPNWLDTTNAPPNRAGGPTGTGITATQMDSVMRDQMRAIRMNAPGTITDIEVFNELGPYTTGTWSIRETVWWRSPGFGYALDADVNRWMVETYKMARVELPGYRLGINDFDVENANDGKAAGYFALISNLTNPARAGGPAPIDWIGFQSHFIRSTAILDPAVPSTVAGIRTQMQQTNDLPADFEIHLTEMDYRMPVPNTNNFDNFDGSLADQIRAGDATHNFFGVCLSYPKVSVLSCWGASDARSWLYGNFPGTGCGLPYGWDYRRKPMWWGLWNAVANQCDKLIRDSLKPTVTIADRDNASAGFRVDWLCDTIGDDITFFVGLPEGNTYNLRVGYYEAGPTAGTVQAAVSVDNGQTWNNLGVPFSTAGFGGYVFVDVAGSFTIPDIQAVRIRFTSTDGAPVSFDYLRIQPTTFTAPPLIITETPQHFCLGAGQSVQRTLRVSEATAEVTARFANPLITTGCTVAVTGTGLSRTVTVTCGANTPPTLAIIIYSTKHNGRKTHSATLVYLGATSTPSFIASMIHNKDGSYRPTPGGTNASQWVVKGAGTRTAVFESGDTFHYVRSTGRTAATDGLTYDSVYEFSRENFMRQKVQVNHSYRLRARVRASANSNITLGVMTVMTNGGAASDLVLTTTAVTANVWTEVEALWTPAPGSIPDGSQMNTYARPFVAGPAAGVTLDVDRFHVTPDNMNAQYP